MQKLIDYIVNHTSRGECQCGHCCDKGPERNPADGVHSVDAGFFWVAAKDDPIPQEFTRLLLAQYPDVERLKSGPSYIEIGAALGSQELAIRMIGLGELCGIWKVLSPKSLHIEGDVAMEMMGNGFLMPAGWNPPVPSNSI